MRKFLSSFAGRASGGEFAAALAAAGVLTAAGWDWSKPFHPGRAARVLDKLGAKRTWRAPPPQAYAQIHALAPDLAAAWKRSFSDHDEPGPARLLLTPSGREWGKREGRDLPDLAQVMLAGLNPLRGREVAWKEIDRSIIGSVAVQAGAGKATTGRWNWPLRVSVEGIRPNAFDASFGPAQRGLTRTVNLWTPSEFAFVHTLEGLESTDASFTTLISPEGRSLASDLIGKGGMPGGGPVALLEDGNIDLPQLARGMVYEAAHDAPPDLALSLAWLAAGKVAGPPIVFAGRDYFARMDAGRLSRNVSDLPRQLKSLARVDDSPLPLSEGHVYGFGLGGDLDLRPSRLATAVEDAVRNTTVRYARESYAAETTVHLAGLIQARSGDAPAPPLGTAVAAPVDAAVTATPPDAVPRPAAPVERKRTCDLTLFRGSLYPGDTSDPAGRLAADAVLEEGTDYTLEVAIRARRQGIEGERAAIDPPREGIETVTVYARILARSDLVLEDQLLPLTWPFDQDSTAAFFRMRVAKTFDTGPLLEVRIIGANLGLLDQIELVREEGKWLACSVAPETPLARPDSGPIEDGLALVVCSSGGGYAIAAEVARSTGTLTAIELGNVILKDDVTRLLGEVRRYWANLVIGQMSNRNALSRSSYARAQEQLADCGQQAWRMIFGDKRGRGTGSSEALGDLLKRNPLSEGSAVRISCSKDARDFVFPWTIVTPPGSDDATPAPWGLSYEIEIARVLGSAATEPAGPVRITALIDDGFNEYADNRRTLDEVVATRQNVSLLPVDKKAELSAALVSDDPSDIFYFFCHGMMASGAPALSTDLAHEILDAAKDLSQVEQAPWQFLVRTLQGTDGGASMSSGRVTLTERDLRKFDFFKNFRRPLVFLNMCHSASSLPGSHAGLPAVFLDRDAIAVIGSEAPITAQFADAFARALFGRLLSGEPLGTAMLASRRAFHRDCNPLALIYTVYGRADVRFRRLCMESTDRSQ